jgi:hypothetical protein|tara:strand:+ start:1191 stop:1382 length:192 start_codon:yes stop_codon:yes gene_type:complete
MNLEDRLNFMAHAVINGKKHLEDLYGDFNEVLEGMDLNSKEFLFGHITGMMEVMRVLIGEEEE